MKWRAVDCIQKMVHIRTFDDVYEHVANVLRTPHCEEKKLVPRLLKKCGHAGIEMSFLARRRSPRHGAGKLGPAWPHPGGFVPRVGLSPGHGGLAIDIGRMCIAKSETQSFVDSAAFAATLELDGTAVGITRAQTAVSNDPKKWQFQNDAFTNVQTSFATASLTDAAPASLRNFNRLIRRFAGSRQRPSPQRIGDSNDHAPSAGVASAFVPTKRTAAVLNPM
jgi:hypothetical protein